ncbi:MAG: hypothetical protein KGS61_06615 [Verrucomicrobia bacterium]|nr:hypothetical protein [Verrucomicrobiota bacterium]
MKKLTCQTLAASVILSSLLAAQAATVTVTVPDDGVNNIGAPGTFYWALTNCSPGDTIAFNIPGAGPHFLQVPPAGFPLIYQKHGITIDGYTQPGAVPNSNPITAPNNAQIQIVIDGRNAHGRSLDIDSFDGTLATSDPPINNAAMASAPGACFGPGELALLGIYRSTNVTIKGLAFLADNMANYVNSGGSQALYGIAIAHDYGLETTIKDALDYPLGDSRNCHVAGCWFGVNPTNRSKSAVTMCFNWINFPRHKGDDGPQPAGDATRRPGLPNVGLTIGVAPGSSNPRSEFNVFTGGVYTFGGEPLRLRVSGNFIGMMPDGVTPWDFSVDSPAPLAAAWISQVGCVVECGRYGEIYASSPAEGRPMVIGTDGDGVNDADEGNLWGPIAGMIGKASLTHQAPAVIHWYRSSSNLFLIAGNTWGIGVDGRRLTNSAFFMSGLYLDDSGDGHSRLIIGSDFASSRSAATIAAQANHFYNNWPLAAFGTPPATDSGIVPFLAYENPSPNNASATTSSNAWVSLRGNVMVGNGLAPINYANGASTLLTAFTNFFLTYVDTNSANGMIPALDPTTSIYPHLAGSFAPGIAPFTNVTIDVYQLDPEGWTNGQAFALAELQGNGFPQGRKYIGSFPVTNSGSFNITLPGLADLGPGQVIVTANYSEDPAGTPLGRTATSDFSNPIYLYPGGATSAGLAQIVPDVACWFDTVANTVTNGFIKLANQPVDNSSGAPTPYATLGNWEPYISSVGDSTFLIEFNTFANDGSWVDRTTANQNFALAKQPAAGGPAKVDYCFYGDNGSPFKGQINLSRQNGNPGRVAGDQRSGSNKFITEAEVSLGQLAAFQTVARWSNNDIYQGNNRYCGEQIFSLDPNTLVQTPVTNAWDYVYGNFVGAMGPNHDSPQTSRTGGRSDFLDNGNIVVMIDDKTTISSTVGEVTTFAIIRPDGSVVKGPTLVDPRSIWDNMCPVKGGFCIRVQTSLYFFDDNGNLTSSNGVASSSGMAWTSLDRGDGTRLGGNIDSYYAYLAGPLGSSKNQVGIAAWDSRTGQFAGGTIVSDGDPAVQTCDRTSVAVNGLDQVCVAYVYQPNPAFGLQTVARVGQFDGANFAWLGHSFYPFVNHDQDPTAVSGFITASPVVAMTTRQICIAAKGTINSTNNATAGPDSLAEQTVYTVVGLPVVTGSPTLTVTLSGTNVVLSWEAADGLFTVQTRSSLASGAWANATAGNVAPPVTLPMGAGPLFIRLAR